MKRLLLAAAAFVALAGVASADTYVNGYYRSNGTYVSPHYRSSPNHTTTDNWSTRGNTNPYTGRAGTRDADDYGSSYTRSRPYGGGSDDFGPFRGQKCSGLLCN